MPHRIQDRPGDKYFYRCATVSIRVFLADDQEMIREGLKTLLESQTNREVIGYAANGRSRLRQKLSIHDLPGLVKFAIKQGLTPVP